jgi:hypothetical protein
MKPKQLPSGGDSQRVLLWLVVSSYIITYIFLYLRTVFFDASGEMFLPNDIHHAWYKIGSDLLGNIHRCEQLLSTGEPDSIGFYFSPLWVIFFNFLSLFDPEALRWVWLLATLGSYVAACLLMPRYFGAGSTPAPATLFIAATGFVSYGLRFELERAQWNAIVFMMCLLAVVLSRTGRRRDLWLAYGLFTVAVHLKLWPIFLVVTLFDLRKGWRVNALGAGFLAFLNLALLFMLGPGFFATYLKSVVHKATDPNIWVGDHSIFSFSRQMETMHGWSPHLGGWLTGLCLLVLLAAVIFRFYQCRRADDVLIVVLCVLAGMLVPSTSNDYKLVILTMVMALLVGGYRLSYPWQSGAAMGERVALLTILGCYQLTLYSHFYKSGWGLLQINTVGLLAIFGAVIALVVLQARGCLREEGAG